MGKEVVIGGIYRHYKRGQCYRVLALAKDHESWEPLVVYQKMYGERDVYVRPLSMFAERVRTADGLVDRFAQVGNQPPLDFEDYQNASRKTAIYPEFNRNLVFPALGLVGEAGEVAEKIKKLWRTTLPSPTSDDRKALAKELGDVLWYLAQLASELRLSLADIARLNLAKIAARQQKGNIYGQGDDREGQLSGYIKPVKK